MTYVQREGQSPIDLHELGVRTKDFIVAAPSYEHTTESIEGMDGVVVLGSTLSPRTIRALFKFASDDWIDFGRIRDDIFSLFDGKQSFYLIDKRQPEKRWKVKTNGQYEIPQEGLFGDFEVNFIAFNGYAESIGTSTMASTFEHLQDLPVTYTDYQDIYATKFKIYNPGKPIDPRNINHYLKISYKGNSENLRIKNITTGDEWAYNGSSNVGDEIVLEGIRSTKNNLSIFRDTNKRLITLDHGWNEFEISGAPDAREYAVQANLPRKRIPVEQKKKPITFEFKFMF